MTDGRSALAQLDLNLLVALDVLLEERSVTRAGERLSRTQPAMSDALRRLRAVFGDELLVRTGQTMRLTPLAEALRAPLHDALGQLEQTVFPTPFDPRVHARAFTIAATDY